MLTISALTQTRRPLLQVVVRLLVISVVLAGLALPTTAQPVLAEAANTATLKLDGMSDRFSASSHTCLVADDGRLTCWGQGSSGQLGYGNTSALIDVGLATNPVNGGFVPLPPGRTVAAVSASNAHTCALLDNGQVTCWGAGAFGRLGYGNTNSIGDNETPAANPVNGGIVPLPAGRIAVAVAGTSVSTCALLDNGQVSCWGWGNAGRLGYGNTNSIGDNETPAANPVNGGVVPLPVGRTATALGGGDAQICAVLDNGSVTCWGYGNFGQLGYGNTNSIGDDETPAQNPVDGGLVRLPVGRTAVGVDASLRHTCALLDDGSLSCRGEGSNGKLGYGNTVTIGDDEKPDANPVNGGTVPFAPGRRVMAMAVGNDYTCALLTDTRLVCLGQTNGLAVDERVGDNEPASAARAIRLPVHRRVVQAALGAMVSCVLLDGGTVSCWGSNAFAQLGGFEANLVGDNEPAHISGGIQLPAERTATQFAVGSSHSCAVLDNGRITCWGLGSNGKLGYGNTNGNGIGDNETPAANPVNGGLVPPPAGRTATAVAAGRFHTCAMLDNGQLTCWVDGFAGKLGYGNQTKIGDSFTPATNPVNGGLVPLPARRSVHSVAAGQDHTCAVLDNGTVACWGDGASGRLGYGNTNDIGDNETPAANPAPGGIVALPGGRAAVSVHLGIAHTCAVSTTAPWRAGATVGMASSASAT